MKIAKPTPRKSLSKTHPIKSCVEFLSSNMSPRISAYFEKEARKRDVSVNQIIARYIISDFGVTSITHTDLF